jgi:hypothetical protein
MTTYRSTSFALCALISACAGVSDRESASAPEAVRQSLVAGLQSVAANEAATEAPYCANAAFCKPSFDVCCRNKFRDNHCSSGYRCCRTSGGDCRNGGANVYNTCCSHVCNPRTITCL